MGQVGEWKYLYRLNAGELRHPESVDVLLIASFACCFAGASVLILGRWRAVACLESGATSARAWTTPMLLGLGAAVVGAVLLLVFITSALTMPLDAAA